MRTLSNAPESYVVRSAFCIVELPNVDKCVSKALEDLQARLAAQSKPNALEQCILTVAADFPGDVGAVAPLFLHLVHLRFSRICRNFNQF